MSKVFQLEHFRRDRMFNEDVSPFIKMINPTFEHHKQDDKAVFYFHYMMYVYIFMKYVPIGVKTDLPTIQESFRNITRNPRVSKGEWVVESLDEIDASRARTLFPMIYAKDKDPHFIEKLREKVVKKAK